MDLVGLAMAETAETAEILVIEDESDLREMIAEELSDSGYIIRQAQDGVEGFNAIRDKKPDLVLCDINMPKLDGYSLLERLREGDRETADIPFIFLTAFADRLEVKRGLDSGADDYITKPIDFDVLIAKVDSRIREVRRFLAQRERELVKLYKALNPSDAASAETTYLEHSALSDDAVIAGRLFIINLTAIRQALGFRRSAWEERIEAIAMTVIRAHVSEDDQVGRNHAGDFVITFKTRSGEEASAVCEMIRQKIEQKFLGEEAIPTWGAETLEVELEPGQRSDSKNLLANVCDRLSELNQSIEAQQEQLVREVDHSGRIALTEVVTATGRPAPLTLARYDKDTRRRIRRLADLNENSGDLLLNLDLLMLDKVCHVLADNRFERRTLVSTDLHHGVAMEKCYRQTYLDVFQKLPERCRNSLAIDLTDGSFRHCPSESDRKNLITQSKLRMISYDGSDPARIDLKTWRAAVLCVDHDQLMAAGAFNASLLRMLHEQVHDQKGRLLVRGIPEAAMNDIMELGADFLAAEAE